MARNVLFYIGKLSSGGAETIVRDYALALKKRGYNVAIVVNSVCDKWPNERIVRDAGIKIYVLDVKNLMNNDNFVRCIINKIYRSCFGKVKFRRIFKTISEEFKPDIMHIHLALLHNTKIVKKYLSDTKLFYTCHSLPQKMFCGANKKEFLSAKKLINQRGLRMIALHKDMAEEINKMFGISNTITINNPIEIEKFMHPKIEKDEMREMLGIPKDAFVIGNVGRFVEVKNHEWLLKVFNDITKLNDKAYLLMVGAGKLKDVIIDSINKMGLSDKCQILSDRTDIPEINNVMDVFVVPSIYEGFSLATVEAQASGLRCVISDRLPSEVILSENISVLPLNGDVNMWVNEILNSDNKMNVPFSEIWEYDIVNIIDKLCDLYEERAYE